MMKKNDNGYEKQCEPSVKDYTKLKRIEGPISNYIHCIVQSLVERNDPLYDDLFQTAFLKYMGIPEDRNQAATLVWQILRNKLIDELRRINWQNKHFIQTGDVDLYIEKNCYNKKK